MDLDDDASTFYLGIGESTQSELNVFHASWNFSPLLPSLFSSFSNASLHDNVPARGGGFAPPRKLLTHDSGWPVYFVFEIRLEIGKKDFFTKFHGLVTSLSNYDN